jgi:hypothetical protein
MIEGLEAVGETAGAVAVEMAVSAILERGGKVGPCTNCSAPMMGNFCGICGQPVETHRRSVFSLVHDLFKDVASFDSRILRTARALLFQPGELALAFREGRTQRYVPAVRLYLFVSLIFFVILSATGIAILQFQVVMGTHQYVTDKAGTVYIIRNGVREPMEDFKADGNGNLYVEEDGKRTMLPGQVANGKVINDLSTRSHFFARIGTIHTTMTPAMREILDRRKSQIDKFARLSPITGWISERTYKTLNAIANDPAAVNGTLTTWIPRVLFLLLPFSALLLATFYWRQRKKFYFVDHLVFSLNLYTFSFVALLAAAGLAQVVAGEAVAWALLAAVGAYMLLAMRTFYRQSWFWTSTKFAFVSFIFTCFFLLPAFAAILAVGVLNF